MLFFGDSSPNKNGWLGHGATTLFSIMYYLLDGGTNCIKMT